MADKEKHVYQSETLSISLRAGLGVPPLPMILVHMANDSQNAATKTTIHAIKTEEEIAEEDAAIRLIVRLIEHLKQES